MEKILVIDGNSILNRAFYGIMSSKMLQTADGTYTNAVYGFLAIMFKELEELNPEYLVVAFDVKHPTKRHELYKEYKGTRKGMPDELAAQMPLIKEVLEAMNICVVEMAGYEADDILGTIAKDAEKKKIEVKLLTGDRDSFQLASDNITIRIPRTKQGKTETENFDRKKVLEVYGVEPIEMIEVKGLMGDTSDNIPGVPGVGEKTALGLIKEFHTIDNIYKKIENGETVAKGKLLEKLTENKDLAYLSHTLGTIDIHAPIELDYEKFRKIDWDYEKTLELFRKLRFNRYIDRFNLEEKALLGNNEQTSKNIEDLFNIKLLEKEDEINDLLNKIKKDGQIFYSFEFKDVINDTLIIKKSIKSIYVFDNEENLVKIVGFNKENFEFFREIFSNESIKKYGYKLKQDYIVLRQNDIIATGFAMDIKVAAYVLNSVSNAYKIEEIAENYLDFDILSYVSKNFKDEENVQTSMFDTIEEKEEPYDLKVACFSYVIFSVKDKLIEEMKKINSIDLFNNIEMPLVEILADMQYEGMFVDERELIKYGDNLKKHLEELRIDIFRLAGEEFNINSPKQLGVILFEKLALTPCKKTKSGYSTDVDALEKVRDKHPIVEKILDYRQIMKLNSTYVEGMIPFINPKTGRIHTFFHQTITATGRLSSSEPNLQNIPTRTEIGKKLRKVFKPGDGKIYVDADYSQVELRILAHMSNDENMIKAFNSGEDIHTITASQIFNVPIEEVSKQLRSKAKAVNFGIVYGISEFGLAEQIDIKRNEAKEYIDKYLETYSGINNFMQEIIEIAKKNGYVETEFNRRRYIPELNSKNYMLRKFGERAAMNTPVQGTAADIMKIAMINVYNRLKKENLKSKIVLQIHDELLIETYLEEKDIVKNILKEEMENAAKLQVPLLVEVEEGKNWYAAK